MFFFFFFLFYLFWFIHFIFLRQSRAGSYITKLIPNQELKLGILFHLGRKTTLSINNRYLSDPGSWSHLRKCTDLYKVHRYCISLTNHIKLVIVLGLDSLNSFFISLSPYIATMYLIGSIWTTNSLGFHISHPLFFDCYSSNKTEIT